MKLVKTYKTDMKNAYQEYTDEKWKKTTALSQVWEAAWSMAIDSVNWRKNLGYYEATYPILDWDDYDEHIGCYSYPNCDIDMNGCCVVNGIHAEPYGHRD
jgi:hypothetical protein